MDHDVTTTDCSAASTTMRKTGPNRYSLLSADSTNHSGRSYPTLSTGMNVFTFRYATGSPASPHPHSIWLPAIHRAEAISPPWQRWSGSKKRLLKLVQYGYHGLKASHRRTIRSSLKPQFHGPYAHSDPQRAWCRRVREDQPDEEGAITRGLRRDFTTSLDRCREPIDSGPVDQAQQPGRPKIGTGGDGCPRRSGARRPEEQRRDRAEVKRTIVSAIVQAIIRKALDALLHWCRKDGLL